MSSQKTQLSFDGLKGWIKLAKKDNKLQRKRGGCVRERER
jgi:hypothetical protein